MIYDKGTLYQLPLNLLIADPEQRHTLLDEQSLDELTTSVANHGVLQPILVRQGDDGLCIIVSGERRFRAAQQAGLTAIPAIVTAGEPAEITIIENLLRENLTAIVEAEAIEQLRTTHRYGLAELAAVVGKSKPTITEILSLNRLPAEVKEDCRQDPAVSRKVLAIIAREQTPEKMLALYMKCKANGLTKGELIKPVTRPKPATATLTAEDIAAFCEKLDRFNGTELSEGQKTALSRELDKLQIMAYRKMRLCRTRE